MGTDTGSFLLPFMFFKAKVTFRSAKSCPGLPALNECNPIVERKRKKTVREGEKEREGGKKAAVI